MWIDIVLLIVAGLGFMVGFSRGIIKTIFTVLSVTIGVIASIRFTPAVTNFLKDLTNEHSPLMFIAGLLLSFTLSWLFLRLISRGLEGILQTANINIINQAAGGALTASVAILVYAVLLSFLVASSAETEANMTQDSRTYPYIKEYPSKVWEVAGELKEPIQKFWSYAIDMMDGMENIGQKSESENYFYDIEDDKSPSKPND
jgi:membrane protein required for colicin V production